MFEVHPMPYGIVVRLRGSLTPADAALLREEILRVLEGVERPFGVLLDARAFYPTGPETGCIWPSSTRLFDEAGRERTAAIVNKATTKIQMERHIKELNKGRTHRILLCCHDEWESCPCLRTAESWVRDGVEPPEVSADDE